MAGAVRDHLHRRQETELVVDMKDADDFHSLSNRKKMAAGQPLDDNDRKPWLDDIRDSIVKFTQDCSQGDHTRSVLLIGCSALKKRYRQVIREAKDLSAEGNLWLFFVYLKADKDLLWHRVSQRKGHFMKSNMVQSQLDSMEEPPYDQEERALDDVITVTQSKDTDLNHSACEILQAERVSLWLRRSGM